MKKLTVALVTVLTLVASAKSNLNKLKTIERYEIDSLTLAKSLLDLNKSKKNTLDLKNYLSLCEAEQLKRALPLNCYLLNERLEVLNLVPKLDYEIAVNSYDNECLNSVPEITHEEELPSSFPRSMSSACVEVIKTQKNKLHYIFLGKKTTN